MMRAFLLAVALAGCGSSVIALDDAGADRSAPVDRANADAATPGRDGACGSYQALCNRQCIPVVADPRNCGACGVTCAGDQACSGGVCSTSCLTGQTICDNACVDVQSESRYCGGCDNACAAGQGCVAGRCEPTIPVRPEGAPCTGGGPAVVVGGFTDQRERCTGGLAQTTFRFAVCSCDSIRLSARLFTDGYDSTEGPYVPGSLGAGVGANGRYEQPGEARIYGPLWCASPDGIAVMSPAEIRQELHLGGPLDSGNTTAVGEDAFVAGNVTTTNAITIGGTLHVPDGAQVDPGVSAASVAREPVRVDPPCDCAADQLIPVAAIVEHHRTDNDNVAIGLEADALVDPGSALRLDLPCGRYYLSQIGTSQPATIVVHGRTALFIDEIDTGAPLTITLEASAELDLFVGGRLVVSGPLTIGSPSYPALTRVWVGSTEGLTLSNNNVLGANLYVAQGELRASGQLEMFGAIFAGRVTASNDLDVHYNRAVLSAGETCGLPPPVAPPPPAGCTTCRDCGNQACIDGSCGACRTSADCCAPLVCQQGICRAFRPQG